jgi:RNA polymerase sigma factor (sigma-70 family)
MLNLLELRNTIRMSIEKSSRKQVKAGHLSDRLKSGDQSAFDELTSLYTKAVYRFFYFQVNSHLVAEDLTETTFLLVWRTRMSGNYQESSDLSHIFQVAFKLLEDYQKINPKPRKHTVHEEGMLSQTQMDGYTAPDKSKEYQQLKRALHELDDDFQTVLVSRFLSGLSLQETAQIMDRKSDAVLLLQYHALTALSQIIR